MVNVPELTVDQKLAIRDLQVESLGLKDAVKTAVQRIQAIDAAVSAIVNDTAKNAGFDGAKLAFDIGKLTYSDASIVNSQDA